MKYLASTLWVLRLEAFSISLDGNHGLLSRNLFWLKSPKCSVKRMPRVGPAGSFAVQFYACVVGPAALPFLPGEITNLALTSSKEKRPDQAPCLFSILAVQNWGSHFLFF